MARRPLVEFILQAINCVFIICGLGTLGYGLVCLVQWKQNPPKGIHEINAKFMIAHRLLLAIDLPNFSSDSLPKAWFIYLLIGIGGILFIISCCGYVGTASKSPCCLLSYCVFLVLLVIVELGIAAFIFFAHNWWKEVIPKDKSGRFHSVYHFLSAHWEVIRWIVLGVFILQVIAMVLALYLRSVFNSAWYDTSYEDEHIVHLPRVNPYNYSVLTPQIKCTSSPIPITTNSNGRGPTKPMKSQ